jgi:hypothetical protein
LNEVVPGAGVDRLGPGGAQQRVVTIAALQVRARQGARELALRLSFPPKPLMSIRVVFAIVAGPKSTGTAPALTKIVPAAFRLTTTALSAESPLTVSRPV